MFSKGISTPIILITLLIIALIIGGFTLWQYGDVLRETDELPEIKLPEKEEVTLENCEDIKVKSEGSDTPELRECCRKISNIQERAKCCGLRDQCLMDLIADTGAREYCEKLSVIGRRKAREICKNPSPELVINNEFLKLESFSKELEDNITLSGEMICSEDLVATIAITLKDSNGKNLVYGEDYESSKPSVSSPPKNCASGNFSSFWGFFSYLPPSSREGSLEIKLLSSKSRNEVYNTVFPVTFKDLYIEDIDESKENGWGTYIIEEPAIRFKLPELTYNRSFNLEQNDFFKPWILSITIEDRVDYFEECMAGPVEWGPPTGFMEKVSVKDIDFCLRHQHSAAMGGSRRDEYDCSIRINSKYLVFSFAVDTGSCAKCGFLYPLDKIEECRASCNEFNEEVENEVISFFKKIISTVEFLD